MENTYTTYKNVVTLIANPEKLALKKVEVDSVVDALAANGAIIEHVEWLAENIACDIFFAVLSQDDVRELLEQLLAAVPFDFVVQNAWGRKKKLFISDMDSTIIEQECIDELADVLGLKEKIARITERAMNGELEFKDALRERVAMLKNLPEEKLQEVYNSKISFMPGAKTLVATMKKNGAKTVLVSGGFTFFTERVRDAIGFDAQEANILEIENGKLTGKVKEPILDKTSKLNALKFYAEELGISLQTTLAAGDGANDLPMIKSAGLGVAYHAKPSVKAQAMAKIDHSDLTALLYAQGYKAEEITVVE